MTGGIHSVHINLVIPRGGASCRPKRKRCAKAIITKSIRSQIAFICERRNVTFFDLTAADRANRDQLKALKDIIRYLDSLLWSYTAIGEFLNRDRTTIKHHLGVK